MLRYFATARYCTRSGNPGSWSGKVDAPDIEAALGTAIANVERRHCGATRIDIRLTAALPVDSKLCRARKKGRRGERP